MLKYTDYLTKEKVFLSLTSLTISEFEDLLIHFTAVWTNRMCGYTQTGKERSRLYSESSNAKLPTTGDKLFFILYYLKNQPLQEALGASFGMTQSQANKAIHRLKPILYKTLDSQCLIPARTAIEFDRRKLDKAIFYTDATERAVPRSVDMELQKEYYSGKKKTHTIKNGIFTTEACEIVFLTDTVVGKTHDKKLNEDSKVCLPQNSSLYQDTGYVGYTPMGQDITVIMPHKKPKGKELTQLQKDDNTSIARVRVKVEHVMAGIKRMRIVKDKVRAWAGDFRDMVMEIACGLHNFRLKYRPWNYTKPETCGALQT